jgi:SOS-response transcriptional repressor LexA
MKTRYDRLLEELETTGFGKMRTSGGSMTPIFPASGCTMHYQRQEEYEVGDIVFCKVRGRWIDAHLITRKGEQGYLISNNHGHDNGWTRKVFGRVVRAEFGQTVKEF